MAAEGATGKAVRVRFAPSPTGTLHVGGARTALYNYLKVRVSARSLAIVLVKPMSGVLHDKVSRGYAVGTT
jgi:hypothetical protein